MLKSLPGKAPLIFLLLATGIVFSSHTSLPQGCDGIEVSVVIKASSIPGKGDIEASATGAAKPYYFVFSKPTGALLSFDFKKSKLKNVDAGNYICTVHDDKGCYKTIEFKIE